MAELFQPASEIHRQLDGLLGSAECAISLHLRARMIRRQFERRRQRRELLLPIRKLRFVNVAIKPFALPNGIVGVLDRRFRKEPRPARSKTFIERRQFAMKDSDRPAVRDDMMHRHQKDVLLLAHLQQHSSDKRPLGQIERAASLVPQNTPGFTFPIPPPLFPPLLPPPTHPKLLPP